MTDRCSGPEDLEKVAIAKARLFVSQAEYKPNYMRRKQCASY